MRLERHVGGLGRERQRNYLEKRGWRSDDAGKWGCARHAENLPMARALHFQLTEDLTAALGAHGWKIEGYSPRGYVKLSDPTGGKSCSLPAALRRQARREGRKVAELTYSLFLGAIV